MEVTLPELPWGFTTRPPTSSVEVSSRRAVYSRPLIMPKLYGQDAFPSANALLPAEFSPPRLSLLKTNDAILLPKHIVLSNERQKLVPQSFLRGRTRNHGGLRFDEATGYTLKKASFIPKAERLEGAFYHADTDFPEIYGHFLMDVLPRLWALSELDRSVSLATSVKIGRSHIAMLSALGIPEDRVYRITRPVAPDVTYLPSAGVRLRDYVHPSAFDIFDRISILSQNSKLKAPDKIYVSRSRISGRKLVNELEVEALFKSAGFAIIHPQELPIEDQIKVFSEAKFIVGTGGSSMHNTVFSSNEAKILMISTPSWFTVIDIFLSQIPDRLGYVFGMPIDDLPGPVRHQRDWVVNVDNVKMSAEEHFEIPIRQ